MVGLSKLCPQRREKGDLVASTNRGVSGASRFATREMSRVGRPAWEELTESVRARFGLLAGQEIGVVWMELGGIA